MIKPGIASSSLARSNRSKKHLQYNCLYKYYFVTVAQVQCPSKYQFKFPIQVSAYKIISNIIFKNYVIRSHEHNKLESWLNYNLITYLTCQWFLDEWRCNNFFESSLKYICKMYIFIWIQEVRKCTVKLKLASPNLIRLISAYHCLIVLVLYQVSHLKKNSNSSGSIRRAGLNTISRQILPESR